MKLNSTLWSVKHATEQCEVSQAHNQEPFFFHGHLQLSYETMAPAQKPNYLNSKGHSSTKAINTKQSVLSINLLEDDN